MEKKHKRPCKDDSILPQRKRPEIIYWEVPEIFEYEPINEFFKQLRKAQDPITKLQKLKIKERHEIKMEQIKAGEKVDFESLDKAQQEDLLYEIEIETVKQQYVLFTKVTACKCRNRKKPLWISP